MKPKLGQKVYLVSHDRERAFKETVHHLYDDSFLVRNRRHYLDEFQERFYEDHGRTWFASLKDLKKAYPEAKYLRSEEWYVLGEEGRADIVAAIAKLGLVKANDYAQGIYVESFRAPRFSLKRYADSRVLNAFGITREEISDAKRPALFGDLAAGDAFVFRSPSDCFVAVKLNSGNAGGGNNCAVIGGRFHVGGKPHDFREGSIVVGVMQDVVCYPIENRRFDARERRAIRHA